MMSENCSKCGHPDTKHANGVFNMCCYIKGCDCNWFKKFKPKEIKK